MKKCCYQKNFSSISAGFTLIEVLVGSFLVLLFFLGIFGAYQLSLKVIAHSKARVIATAIANEYLEAIRNLPYDKVGTINGYPAGELPSVTSTESNNITFNIATRIDFIADGADGFLPPQDLCPNDYKRVRIEVSWRGFFSGNVNLATDIVPDNEVQECEETGGILAVNVFDSQGLAVNNVLIEVKDISSVLEKQCLTTVEGSCRFILPESSTPENYKITVSKDNYSTSQTFAAGENYNGKTIANPEKPNATILEGLMTELSFAIDKLSSLTVSTKSSRGRQSFSDTFENFFKISEYNNVVIEEGVVKLARSNGNYFDSGYLISEEIAPSILVNWGQLSFEDSEPQGTEIKYQLFYFQEGEEPNWQLVPDVDLPGNSSGFSQSPVELSSLNSELYKKLKIKGLFSTSDLYQTPLLESWQLSYDTKVSYFIDNVDFQLEGEKIVGKDSQEQPIYKYSALHNSGETGQLTISGLEWDNYKLEIDRATTGLDLIESEPKLPLSLLPDADQAITLFLEGENSLLVKVKDEESENPIFSAQVQLQNSNLNYDETQLTNQDGETFFIPLQVALYELKVSAPGYQTSTSSIWVSGETATTTYLLLTPS